ncbi:tetratricopeptide repeat protein [Rhodoferax sp. GW822-FHT02A01]|uniref:tetratricopeptide repeat protein n=1 Tax=Rhodoferax sp. GW822-FHT02A01 TaxID=3141537 RepID=UPI00315C56FD
MEESVEAQAAALFQQGLQLQQTGHWGDAERCYRQAIALADSFAEAHGNLGFVLDQQGDKEQAEACYRASIVRNPTIATIHLNLGALLARQKRHGEAEASYAAALALEPESSAVWSNLGALNLSLQREETAEACLRHAITLSAENANARFNLAYLQLRRGSWEEGWQLFESRDWYRALAQRLPFSRWQGQDLAGKTLLACYEAGHGDMIHLVRYIPLLKARGAHRVELLCHPALTTLLQTVEGVDAVHPFDGALPQATFDFWMPLLSAPLHFHTRPDNVPAPARYLQTDPDKRANWAGHLPPPAGRRVGLVWKGNPKFENDRDRSLAHLGMLSPLWDVPGVQYVSLQKGMGEDEVPACASELPLVHLGSAMQDFADAAAIIDQLDLVIAVDTAMAHLAGALGKPCWLLLPWYMTDWRWGAEGNTSVWYPQSMRLFRQSSDGDWETVIANVAQALRDSFPFARVPL